MCGCTLFDDSAVGFLCRCFGSATGRSAGSPGFSIRREGIVKIVIFLLVIDFGYLPGRLGFSPSPSTRLSGGVLARQLQLQAGRPFLLMVEIQPGGLTGKSGVFSVCFFIFPGCRPCWSGSAFRDRRIHFVRENTVSGGSSCCFTFLQSGNPGGSELFQVCQEGRCQDRRTSFPLRHHGDFGNLFEGRGSDGG